jgi:type II secretory pathway component PulF
MALAVTTTIPFRRLSAPRMLFEPRIRLKPLAQLCRRLATTTAAGIQDRRIWRDEASRGGRAQRAAIVIVADELSRGRSIDDALAAAGGYFPPLFRQLVAVGDASGQLDRTYRRLAEHYEHMLAARRTLLAALAWPVFELSTAVLAVGVIIWISSALGLKNMDGEPLDMFGLGLTGSNGLAVYIIGVIAAVIAVLLVAQAWSRGMLWTRSLQRLALRIPGIGDAVRTMALARFTWAMQLVLETSMDLRKALPLALDATGNELYRSLGPHVANSISRGSTLHSALEETGAFPKDLLEAISVGEETGMLAETMERQSRDYQQRAVSAIGLLAIIFGGVIWALVLTLIVVLIFRVYGGHINDINRLADPNFKV